MGDDRLQILRMLEEGKVSAEEAAQLLEAVGSPKGSAGVKGDARVRNRMLRVHVKEGEKTKVNVNLPLSLARVALNFVPKGVLEQQGIDGDLGEIVRMLEEGFEGKLVDVEEQDTNTKVEVWVE